MKLIKIKENSILDKIIKQRKIEIGIIEITTSWLRLVMALIAAVVLYNLFYLPRYHTLFHISLLTAATDYYLYGAALVVLVFFLALNVRGKGNWVILTDILTVALLGPMIYHMVQTNFIIIDDSNLISERFPYHHLTSAAITTASVLILYVITGRLRLSIIVSGVLWYLLSVANHFVYLFRQDILCIGDIIGFRTGLDVAGNYQFSFDGNLFVGGVFFLAIMIAAFNASWKIKSKKLRWGFRGGVGIVTLVFLGCFFSQSWVDEEYYSWHPEWNDYAFAFVANIKFLNVREPESYDLEHVSEILQKNQSDDAAATDDEEVKPTIIAIMNESFSDLSLIGNLNTTDDPLPFYHALMQEENVVKGNCAVEVYGSGTCDSEYSFLTGNTTSWVPKNARPFQLYVNGTTPNIATTLNDQGYTSYAMHPGNYTSWNRNNVYPDLNFSDFYYKQNYLMDPKGITTTGVGWISDETCYRHIEELYEEKKYDENLFMFNVTIANHGGYEVLTPDLAAEGIKAKTKGTYPDAEIYLDLMKKTDTELEGLINYFRYEDAPVIICVFGDHQPSLNEAFYEELLGKPKEEWTDEEVRKQYLTPFFIWANYDIPEKDYGTVSLNYVSSILLQTAGVKTTAFNKYLLDTMETLPIISSMGVKDNQNNYYDLDDETSNFAEMIKDFRNVNYNNLFDNRNRLNDYYYLKNSKILESLKTQ